MKKNKTTYYFENKSLKNGKYRPNRREFIRLTSAGFASLALVSACKNSIIRNILPYTANSGRELPGKIEYYSSCCLKCAAKCPVIIKTYEQRPVRVLPNSFRLNQKGRICRSGIASLYEFYSDKRITYPLLKRREITLSDAIAHLKSLLESNNLQNKPFYFLTPVLSSPSYRFLLSLVRKNYPHFRHVIYDLSANHALYDIYKQTFDKSVYPVYQFEKTKIIISFDDDFLNNFQKFGNYFSARETDVLYDMNYHLQLESHFSLTGAYADQRMTLSPDAQYNFLVQLCLAVDHKLQKNNTHSSGNTFIDRLASRLTEFYGKSLILSGSHQTEFQSLVAYLNQLLGNFGRTILLVKNEDLISEGDLSFSQFLNEISESPEALIISAECHDSLFEYLIGKNSTIIRLAQFPCQNNLIPELTIPSPHFIESYSDESHPEGFISFCQAVSEKLYQSIQPQELLLKLIDYQESYREFIIKFYRENTGLIETEEKLNICLQQGYVSFTPDILQVNKFSQPDRSILNLSPRINQIQSITMYIDEICTTDAYNLMLKDFADPISKVLNEDIIYINWKFALEKELKTGDVIDVKYDNIEYSFTVIIHDGIPDHTLVLPLKHSVKYGYKAFRLLNYQNNQREINLNDVKISKNHRKEKIVRTQGNGKIKNFAIHEFELDSYLSYHRDENEISEKYLKTPKFNPQWAMVIDLNKCTGCGNCVAACQAENNIPFIGYEEIGNNRWLNWIRIEINRTESDGTRGYAFIPVMCQHCENAPCERVCPVGASTHSMEGLNQQIYERCIGARFCNNNCPYLARTFNYRNYAERAFGQSRKLRMLLNPDVSVREKGISEKCTFCIQRIQEAKREAKINNRVITDGSIRTACEEACPAGAITFGNLADPSSRVARFARGKRAFWLLPEKGTKPNVIYLAKIRNKNFTGREEF